MVPDMTSGMWNLPRPHFDLPEPDVDPYMDDSVDRILARGSIFGTKARLQEKLVHYLVEQRAGMKTDMSDKHMYWVCCPVEDCEFMLRARDRGSTWVVYRFIPHTCTVNPDRLPPSTLPSRHLGTFIGDEIVLDESTMTPVHVQATLKRRGVTVLVALARKIRAHAIASLFEDHDTSFQMVPSFLYMLEQQNPGTVTDYMLDRKGRFKYAFFALSASIKGWNHMRPFIVIDDTHLKRSYNGILFVAVTKDGNNMIYPLAFFVGSVESVPSWTWFLLQLRRALDIPDDVLIVSDGSPAIRSAVYEAMPTAHHVLCCVHLAAKILKHGGKSVVDSFTAVAYAFKNSEYERHMKTLQDRYPGAYRYLVDVIGPEKWARVRCVVRHYDIMTTNIVESMNRQLRWARRLPICFIFEVIRAVLSEWFTERHNEAAFTTGPLTEWANECLLKAREVGDKLPAKETNHPNVYHVKQNNKTCTVDLGIDRMCTCKLFQCMLIPCAHAAGAIKSIRGELSYYVPSFYKRNTLLAAWGERVFPMAHSNDWQIPRETTDVKCATPKCPRQAGRPRQSRIPSATEKASRAGRRQRYRRCGEFGLKERRCTAPVEQDIPGPSEPRQRRKKRCSRCGEEGHTVRLCQLPSVEEIPNLNDPDQEWEDYDLYE